VGQPLRDWETVLGDSGATHDPHRPAGPRRAPAGRLSHWRACHGRRHGGAPSGTPPGGSDLELHPAAAVDRRRPRGTHDSRPGSYFL